MSRIADRFPLKLWESGEIEVSAVYASESENWARGGMRPLNHLKRRLKEYQRLTQTRSDWPSGLKRALRALPNISGEWSTKAFRRKAGISTFQRVCYEQELSSVAGRTRCNTAMVDAFLPMAEAAGVLDAFWYWWHWPGGDRPERQYQFLKKAGLYNRNKPNCNGMVQGILELFVHGGESSDCIDLI
ncbi:MAG: Uncharacterised protein [Opitutia bacterium UBA7350]|nr:MAG: Uncharacterised protein [Opitutae bacterium UBA7350]